VSEPRRQSRAGVTRLTLAKVPTYHSNTESPARKTKVALRLAKEVVQSIYDNKLVPGQRYLSESEALQRLGASRGTYREALRFLEIQGILEIRAGPGGGPEIRRPSWPQLSSTIALLLQFAEAPLRVILEARIVLEPGVAKMAAANATDGDIATMARDLDAIEDGLGDYRKFAPAYLRYWNDLAESTHNAFLSLLSPALRAIVNTARAVPNEPYRVHLLERLRAIHAAVAAHDQATAATTVAALEEEFLRRLMTGYPRHFDRVVAWSDIDADLGVDPSVL
jgi:GntR family transcriptional repressor for pyruvate dehydrogenase complex